MAGHWGTEASKLLSAAVRPVLVINLSGLEHSSNRQFENVLTQGVRVARHNGVVAVYFQHTHLGFVDAITNKLIDVVTDERVIQHPSVNHQRLDVAIFDLIKIVFAQAVAFHKQNGLAPVAAEHILNLVHCRSNQPLNIVVVQSVALDELVVECAFALQLLGAGLGNTKCVPIIQTVLNVVVAALVAIPQLHH